MLDVLRIEVNIHDYEVIEHKNTLYEFRNELHGELELKFKEPFDVQDYILKEKLKFSVENEKFETYIVVMGEYKTYIPVEVNYAIEKPITFTSGELNFNSETYIVYYNMDRR